MDALIRVCMQSKLLYEGDAWKRAAGCVERRVNAIPVKHVVRAERVELISYTFLFPFPHPCLPRISSVIPIPPSLLPSIPSSALSPSYPCSAETVAKDFSGPGDCAAWGCVVALAKTLAGRVTALHGGEAAVAAAKAAAALPWPRLWQAG